MGSLNVSTKANPLHSKPCFKVRVVSGSSSTSNIICLGVAIFIMSVIVFTNTFWLLLLP